MQTDTSIETTFRAAPPATVGGGFGFAPADPLQAANSGAMWAIVAFIAGRLVPSWMIAGEPDRGSYFIVILMWVGAAVAAGPLFEWAGFFHISCG